MTSKTRRLFSKSATYILPVSYTHLVVYKRQVNYRRHTKNLHRFCIKQNAEVSIVPVWIQNQSVQNAHTPKGVFAADGRKILQQLRHRSLFTEDASCLCQPLTFACEQAAFTDEFSMRQV